MEEALFKCKIEDLPFLGTLILDNFTRDENDFVAFSPDYKNPFGLNCQTRIKAIEELVAPKKLTGEMKQITRRLTDHFIHSRNLANKLERYVEKATGEKLALTLAPEDFGFKAVREQSNLKNDEGVVKELRILKKNMADNLTVLEPKGYTAEVQTELDTLITGLSDDSIAQTRKKKEREQLVKANTSEFNKYWLLIDDILATGKTIYKEKDKSKVKDYTYTELIKDVQMKRKAQDNGGEETNGNKEAK